MSEQDDAFSWRRDFKHINWGSTLQFNLFRAVGAGIFWTCFGILAEGKLQSLLMLIFFPLIYFLFFLPMGLFAAWLSGVGIPYVGVVAGVISLFVSVGDPFVLILKKIKPELIPVDSPKFFSLRTIIFVINMQLA